MNIVLNKEDLTCLITDSAENPTKHCFIIKNPSTNKPFDNVQQLKAFAESIANNPNIYSPMPTEEPVAEPVA